MLSLLFTLDYEIHGNGEGSPAELMVEPTDRMLRLFDDYGAKLTIMADIGEILKFRDYLQQHSRDDYSYRRIVEQLQRAVRTGHDVQLHIHSSYFNARHENGRWLQDWSEYNFAGLPLGRMDEMVRVGKAFLEETLKPVRADYFCHAFRAANWSVSPSQNVVNALLNNGIWIDSSVFKYGKRSGIVTFDYTSAHHPLVPWPALSEDLCRCDPSSALWEFPIYSEERWLGAFANVNRVYRALIGRRHRVADLPREPVPKAKAPKARLFFQKHAWKADFNQCSGQQLKRSLLRAERQVGAVANCPFVLIGHSKLFTRWNEYMLRPLLAFVRNHDSRFSFGTFKDFKATFGIGSPALASAATGV